ncbi:RNA-binding protein spenito-like [Ylistrum balloti]|uniref:RNA-binding protein spenito-like n=1 Tax=Ylistrum balloti TaxID=509963 RepID=UPI00290589EF|nr:RNA-binding protein spenito-like [Ylistrum balloti]
MKRMQDRENSPRSKRSRSGYPGLDHESSRDRMSPDMDRRDSRGREPKPKPYRDFDHDLGPMPRGNKYHDRMGDGFGPARSEVRGPEYRSLCLSNISSKIPDAVLKDNLYHEFKKFGEFNVNVTFTGDQRVAYINFRYPEDARAAKHNKSKLIVFDRPVRVDPVFHRRRSSSPNTDMGRDYGGPSKGYGHNSPPMQYGGMRGDGMGRGGGNRRQNMGRGYFTNQDDMPPPMRSMDRDNYQPQHFHKEGGVRKAPNEKFPYHLDHINPEDDIKATRTLFVGNLDYNIDLMELRQIFERYGAIEDIDVKRPQRGQGNAYAFLKYMNLDCAHRAKVEMSGQYIGRFQCKIGYGKVTPTTCLWVGGLGPWVTHQALEREFDRFGVIDRIEWPHSKNYAYVLYDNIDAATAACQEMRGFPLGDSNRRLRVDFADVSHIQSSPRPNDPPSPDGRDMGRNPQWRPPYDGPGEPSHRDDWPMDDRGPNQRNLDPRDNNQRDRGRDMWEGGDRNRRPRTPDEFMDRQHRRSKSQENKYDQKDRDVGRNRDNGRRPMHSQERDFSDGDRGDSRRFDDRRVSQGDKETEKALEMVENIADMSKCLPAAWNGALILKSSAFPARMHVVGGNVTLVDNMMRDPSTTETPVLKVKQRLRLDQPKLEDVGRRVTGAGPRGHCILLALSGSLQNYEDTSVQQRPLKNLVTYLRQKDAAGVISLPNYDSKDKDNVGVLYAFPPCQFGYDYLMTKAPRLPPEPAVQDDYMVIVVIRGAA